MEFASKITWGTRLGPLDCSRKRIVISCADRGLDDERDAIALVVERLGMLVSCQEHRRAEPSSRRLSFDAMVLLLRGCRVSESEPGATSVLTRSGVGFAAGLDGDDLACQTFDELMTVAHDAEIARVIALRSGFPRSRLPGFTTPLCFWTNVVKEAVDGVLRDGMRPIIEAAAAIYPNNETFAQYRSQFVSGRLEVRGRQSTSVSEDDHARLQYERCKLHGIPVFAFCIQMDAPVPESVSSTSSWRNELLGCQAANGLDDLRSKASSVLTQWLLSHGPPIGPAGESTSPSRADEHRAIDRRTIITLGAGIIGMLFIAAMNHASGVGIYFTALEPPVPSGEKPEPEVPVPYPRPGSTKFIDEAPSRDEMDPLDRILGELGTTGSGGGLDRLLRRGRKRFWTDPPGEGHTESEGSSPQSPIKKEEEDREPHDGGMISPGSQPGASGSNQSGSPGAPEPPPQEEEDQSERKAMAPRHIDCDVYENLDDGDSEGQSLIAGCSVSPSALLHLEVEASSSGHCRGIDAIGIMWGLDCGGFHILGWSLDPALCSDPGGWMGGVIKEIDFSQGSEVSIEELFCPDGPDRTWSIDWSPDPAEGSTANEHGPDSVIFGVLESKDDSTDVLVSAVHVSGVREFTVRNVDLGSDFVFVLHTKDPAADPNGCLDALSRTAIVTPNASNDPASDDSRKDSEAEDEPYDGFRFSSGAESEAVSEADWLTIPVPGWCEEPAVELQRAAAIVFTGEHE